MLQKLWRRRKVQIRSAFRGISVSSFNDCIGLRGLSLLHPEYRLAAGLRSGGELRNHPGAPSRQPTLHGERRQTIASPCSARRYEGSIALRPHRPRRGWPPWHSVMLGTLVLALILTPIRATGSAKTDGVLAVSAQVLPRTTLQVRSVPLDLLISARDVRQAYVDVHEPTRVDVSNNSPQGYELLVTPNMPGLTGVIVRGAGAEVSLGGEGGAIPERGRVGVHMALALRYRFLLGPRIEAGRYSWPVQLTVRPLTP